jgi:hypothetical protein
MLTIVAAVLAFATPPTAEEPIVVADRRIAKAELDDRATRTQVDSRRAQPVFYRLSEPLEVASDEAAEQRWVPRRPDRRGAGDPAPHLARSALGGGAGDPVVAHRARRP